MSKPTPATARVVRAVTSVGVNPEHHQRQLDRLRREWPTLYYALMALVGEVGPHVPSDKETTRYNNMVTIRKDMEENQGVTPMSNKNKAWPKPFRLAPPEFLESKADYTDVPEGTILTKDGLDTAWVKKFDGWASTGVSHERSNKELGYTRRRVLRWGWGK